METIGLIIVFAIGFGIWWWWNKRRPAPPEDTWVLPSEAEAPSTLLRSPTVDAATKEGVERPDYLGRATAGQLRDSDTSSLPPQILDRDTLLNRNKNFDPSNWDNRPDS